MKTERDSKNRRILVIDDQPSIHDAFRKVLGAGGGDSVEIDRTEEALFGHDPGSAVSEGFQIDSAHQGREGMELMERAVRAHRPHAMAFVDVRMPPGWDGIETVKHLWEVDARLQVVLCTAYSDYSWPEIISALGETDRLLILKKPFDHIEVRQLAAALTEKWNLARQIRCKMKDLDEAVRERSRALQEQQKKLEKTHAQLLHAQKMESIGQLAAGIAHEINTPTQFIGDNTRFLEGGLHDIVKMVDAYEALLDPANGPRDWKERVTEIQAKADELDIEFVREEMPKAIQQTLDGVDRVATIVRSMKEFSHPGGKEKSAVDLNKAVETTITVARNEWKYVAQMQTDFDASLPTVSCLPGDINQVILNLLINAAHAIADVVGDGSTGKGTITVSTRHDDGFAEIRISDTGTGIPEENRSRIFDPFFTTKEVGKGTGQGLAIAHSVVVDKHGGTIRCESEVGRGTTFIIRLPLEPVKAECGSA